MLTAIVGNNCFVNDQPSAVVFTSNGSGSLFPSGMPSPAGDFTAELVPVVDHGFLNH